MSHPNHAKHEKRPYNENPPVAYWSHAHRDWKFWIAVALMLVAMLVYIRTLDLSLRPAPNAPAGAPTEVQPPLP